jgi:phosphatidate cytidylyltransferase
MLAKRLLVIVVLLPIGILAIILGGWFYALVILAFCGVSAWEYTQLMRQSGKRPAIGLVIGGTLALVAQRQLDGFENGPLVFSLLILASMTYHMVMFERGRDEAATDFATTLAGILYLGWIGGYLVSLRSLPNGVWWTALALVTVWAADGAPYVVGWGRRPLSPRLSPNKTWEGYWGSVVGGLLSGAANLLSSLGQTSHPGMGAAPTLGDLGESMIKRQAKAKDCCPGTAASLTGWIPGCGQA